MADPDRSSRPKPRPILKTSVFRGELADRDFSGIQPMVDLANPVANLTLLPSRQASTKFKHSLKPYVEIGELHLIPSIMMLSNT
jgi:hypothetical protein